MKRNRVYLSGGMQYASDGGASWRSSLGEWLHTTLGHTVIDPVTESEKILRSLRRKGWRLPGGDRTGGDWPRFFPLIVDRDVRLVRSSQYIICLWNESARRGAGTQGELTVAREARIPVYLVTRSSLARTPGWVQGCTTKRFTTITQLKSFLETRFID